jgi:hypothetical protein
MESGVRLIWTDLSSYDADGWREPKETGRDAWCSRRLDCPDTIEFLGKARCGSSDLPVGASEVRADVHVSY